MTGPRENPAPVLAAGAVRAAAAMAEPSAPPTVPGAEWPAYKPHRELADAPPGCDGILRWDHQDGPVWSWVCDGCGEAAGVSAERVAPEVRRRRLLSAACLPARFIDREYTTTPDNRSAVRTCHDLLRTWGTPEQPRPPMLCGPVGRGKTHLIVRAAHRLLCEHGVAVRYCTFADLLDEAKLAMDRPGESSQEVFEHAARVPLLVLDDLGAGMNSDWTFNVLEALVDRRYRAQLPLMGTTNAPPGQWAGAFGARAGSRLMELCTPVAVTGSDWRAR